MYQQQPAKPRSQHTQRVVITSNDPVVPSTISIADELAKLAKFAKLKEQGVLSESEFQQMKQDLLTKMYR